jgi:hypothetical protein
MGNRWMAYGVFIYVWKYIHIHFFGDMDMAHGIDGSGCGSYAYRPSYSVSYHSHRLVTPVLSILRIGIPGSGGLLSDCIINIGVPVSNGSL